MVRALFLSLGRLQNWYGRPSGIPAQAGIQTLRAMLIPLGSGLRRNDEGASRQK